MTAIGFGVGLGLRPCRTAAGAAPTPSPTPTPSPAPASTITGLVVLGTGPLPDGSDAADGNGWVARVMLPEIAGATFDPTRIVLTVRDPGFEDGAAVTRTRTVRGGAVIRRQAPNQAQRLAGAAAGVMTVHFSLAEDVYAGSTLLSATAEAGYYGAAPAGSVAGLANQSSLAYPKPLAGALNRQEERATGSAFAFELVAVHCHAMRGRQVDCIKAIARDESGNTTPEIVVTQPALSDFQTAGNRPEAYKGSIPLAPLNQGQTCRVEWEVYPHIGDASAVLRVATDGFAWPTPRPHTPLRFLCDKTGGYGGAHAAVRIGASGGAVAASRASAEATPYPTIAAALAAVRAWNAANKGHDDHSGATIWLMEASAGAGADHVVGSTSAIAAGKCWTEIRVSPGATGLVRAVVNEIVGVADKLCFACPVHNSGFTALDGGGGTSRMLAFEGATLSQGGSLQINYQVPLVYWRNVTVTSGPNPLFTFSNVRSSAALALGVTLQSGVSGLVAPYIVAGCRFDGQSLGEFPTSHPDAVTHDGAIIVSSMFMRLSVPCQLGFQRPVAVGIGMLNVVIERAATAPSEPALQIGADSAVQPLANVVLHHLTVPGVDISGRSNLAYADVAGAAGVMKRVSRRGCIFSQFNIKSDTFGTGSGRTGNWHPRYGVGSSWNVVARGDTDGATAPDASGGNWIGEYADPGTALQASMAFMSDQSGQARLGGGDYRLTGASSPAYGRIPGGRGLAAFDLVGTVRRQDGSGAAGAFERTV